MIPSSLSQFVANSSHYTGHVSLIFLLGNHTPDREVILYGADYFPIEPQEN